MKTRRNTATISPICIVRVVVYATGFSPVCIGHADVRCFYHPVYRGVWKAFLRLGLPANGIGMDRVLGIIRAPIRESWSGFSAMLLFSGLFYGVFARLREQVCTTICPYGRLQSVLLVKDSIVVAYDPVRGEPRIKLKKEKPVESPQTTGHRNPVQQIRDSVGAASEHFEPTGSKTKIGDCIDCKLCVAVCPTGIDIRNGTQLECTNCTACMGPVPKAGLECHTQ
jgi:ferredoxin